MKVVLFIHSLGGGGAERVTSHLANAWADRGWEITLVTLAPPEGDFYELRPCIGRTWLDVETAQGHITRGPISNLRRVRALRRVLEQLDPDVVLAMMTTASVVAVLAAAGLRCRTIVTERSFPPRDARGRAWSVLRRLTYPWASRTVVLSEETRQWMRTHAGCRRIDVIRNPVVFPLPVGAPNLVPDTEIAPGRKLLLALGRLGAEKGFDVLLRSFAIVAATHDNWDLAIVGEGPERPALERLRGSLGLANRVHLPGRTGNAAAWYARADLYALTSHFEGFPNTLVEAMASGCAVVSFDCDTGPRDIIRHGHDGLLVRPVSGVEEFAQALTRLMGDDGERCRLAANAHSAKERFSLERILADWDQALQRA